MSIHLSIYPSHESPRRGPVCPARQLLTHSTNFLFRLCARSQNSGLNHSTLCSQNHPQRCAAPWSCKFTSLERSCRIHSLRWTGNAHQELRRKPISQDAFREHSDSTQVHLLAENLFTTTRNITRHHPPNMQFHPNQRISLHNTGMHAPNASVSYCLPRLQ